MATIWSPAETPAESLTLRLDCQDVNLMEWLERQGKATYPDIGKRTWRVPPVRFNVQKTHEVKAEKIGSSVVLGLEQPAVTDQASCYVENLVFSGFENLSDSLLNQSEGKALFLITNFEYDNYLNKVDLTTWMKKKQHDSAPPPSTQASDVSIRREEPSTNKECGSHECAEEPPCGQRSKKESQKRYSDTSWLKHPGEIVKRGELDGLILHEKAGILLLQIKATGYNFDLPSDGCLPQKSVESVVKAVEKAGRQLLRDHMVMSYIMEDMNLLDSHMTSIVALPNLTREMFELVLNASPNLKLAIKDEFHLCCDNFLFAEEFHQEKGCYSNLHKWWTEKLSRLAEPKGFNIDMMEKIIYRTVGLLSTVSVWTCRQPRAEVRTLNKAVVETGKRFAQMILSPRQAEVLKREDQYLYIWGAAGSGKTLLLSLKGRHWQRKKYGVVILNTRLGTKGRDVGHVIEKMVNDSEGGSNSIEREKVMRIDFDLMDDPSSLKEQVLNLLDKKKSIKVILDEISWMPETIRLLEYLMNLSNKIVIWCAGMLEEFCPEGFTSERLYDVLRCPPFVQRLLKIVDNREERCRYYSTLSAKSGLPTDGPRPFFVIHSKHSQRHPPTVLPYDCSECAQMVANFLKEKLQLSSESHSNLSKFTKRDGKDKMRSSSHGEFSFTDLALAKSLSKSRSNTCPNLDESVCKAKKTPKKKRNSRKGKSKGVAKLSTSDEVKTDNQETADGEKTDEQISHCDEKRNSEGHVTMCDTNHNEKRSSEGHVTMRDTNRKKRNSRGQIETSEDVGVQGKTGNLQFSDVVLPVTMPIPWHRFNDRDYYSISYEALAQNMHLMGSSVFCTTLLDSGIRIKIETGMCMDVNSDENEDVLIMCPVGKVHGLEYKVVICMPNFCALKEKAEFNEGIFQAQNGPWTQMKRTSFGDELVARHPVFEEQAIKESNFDKFSVSELLNWSMIKPKRGIQEAETDQIRISTHVDGPPTDVLYCVEKPEGLTISQDQGTPTVLTGKRSCSLESQMHPDVNSPRNGRRDSNANLAEESTSGALHQEGDGTLKTYLVSEENLSALPFKPLASVSQSALSVVSQSTASPSVPIPNASASSQMGELSATSSSVGISSVCSASILETSGCGIQCEAEKAQEKCNVDDFTEAELQALNQLSDWDKAYVLMSASRCTAQLIMVLP